MIKKRSIPAGVWAGETLSQQSGGANAALREGERHDGIRESWARHGGQESLKVKGIRGVV